MLVVVLLGPRVLRVGDRVDVLVEGAIEQRVEPAAQREHHTIEQRNGARIQIAAFGTAPAVRERSEEADTRCLGIIPGDVRALEPSPGMPVPHMGWSRVDVQDPTVGLQSGDYVYFAHGFACDPGPATVASTDYGREIPAVVRRGNWLGAQFHPERSADAGARFLAAFLG